MKPTLGFFNVTYLLVHYLQLVGYYLFMFLKFYCFY
jgi:hypothetical protein